MPQYQTQTLPNGDCVRGFCSDKTLYEQNQSEFQLVVKHNFDLQQLHISTPFFPLHTNLKNMGKVVRPHVGIFWNTKMYSGWKLLAFGLNRPFWVREILLIPLTQDQKRSCHKGTTDFPQGCKFQLILKTPEKDGSSFLPCRTYAKAPQDALLIHCKA